MTAIAAFTGCGVATTDEVSTDSRATATPTTSTQCGGSTGLDIALANNSGQPDTAVNWFVQQTRVGAPNPELIAGPFTYDKTNSVTCGPMNAGQVVITFGNDGSVTPPAAPVPNPADQPTYSQPSPDTEPKRFQTVELTIPGIVNLTAVDMVGIPIDMATSDGTSRVWKCYTDVVQASLRKTLAAAGGDYSRTVRTGTNGKFLRLVSPNIVSGLNKSGYPKFDAYLSSLNGQTLTVKRTKGVDYSPYGYSYSGVVKADGSIVFAPTDKGSKEPSLTIPVGTLTSNDGVPAHTGIYGNNSPYLVGASKTNHYVSENDKYAAIYRDVVAAFAYGFWSKGGANDSSQFSTQSSSGPFQGAQPKNADRYNAWAAALWPVTGAYGFAFEDTFNPGDRNPAIPVKASGQLTLTIQPDITPPNRGC
ncbi:MAG: hypothetical protein HQ526_04615 [Actinobacteria bacterium]|nr:hypothetical protein [Actinomycetota bacterium]